MTPSRRRLKVVRIYLHLDVGGIETRLVDLLPRLDRERFEVEFVCIRRPGVLAPALAQQGIPVHHSHYRSKLPFALSAWMLARFLRRLRPDIVHCHSTLPMLVGTAAAQRAGVPVIVGNCHNVGVFARPEEVRRERRLSSLRDTTLHVSRSVYEDYLRSVQPEKTDGVVLYNGVDVERFARRPEDDVLRRLTAELNLEGCGPLLIQVARLHRQKSHDVMLEAFTHILAVHPQAVLLVAGDGNRRDAIEAEIRDRALGDSVRMLGSRRDVANLYHLADVGVLPSAKEGFSNVVLEAMAAGIPQVLTDVGGNREAVGESGCALIVPPGDPGAFADAVLQVVGDPQQACSMGNSAAERAARFSVSEQVRRTEELYLELAEKKGLA
jgi:glycosyltransferase involved in cell wall biosynthesis